MKRMKPIILVLFISFLPLSFALGQEKKNERKVKVVIADKSGTKVVIDTTFTDTDKADSIILEEGTVIYIGDNYSESDSKPGKHVKVITQLNKDEGDTEHQYVYINDDKVIRHDRDKRFDIMVSDNEFDNDLDKTKFVIAKNGITVTVEGNDEAKVKELVNEIEKKMIKKN
jgi:hypothetical protein